jgi:predicted small metal-binding protein
VFQKGHFRHLISLGNQGILVPDSAETQDCGLECSFHASGINERQIAQEILQHMHLTHDMEVIPADVMIKIYYSIRNKNTVTNINPAPAPVLLEAK